LGKRLLIVLDLLIATTLQVVAQNGYSNLEFIENKGQWDKRVVLKGELNNGSFFLQKQGFTVLLHNPDDLRNLRGNHQNKITDNIKSKDALPEKNRNLTRNNILHSHNYSVSFKGSNDNIEIIPDKPLPTYNNYFIGKDPSKWASNCRIYQGVTYKNVYPNIDIRYYSDGGSLKYDIVINPGANPGRL